MSVNSLQLDSYVLPLFPVERNSYFVNIEAPKNIFFYWAGTGPCILMGLDHFLLVQKLICPFIEQNIMVTMPYHLLLIQNFYNVELKLEMF